MIKISLFFGLLMLSSGCGDGASTNPDAGSFVDDGGFPDAGVEDLCPDDACIGSCASQIRSACILPTQVFEEVPFSVRAVAESCISGSGGCTVKFPSRCSFIQEGNRLTLSGETCTAIGDRERCTASDCSGSNGTCEVPGLPAGEYFLVVEGLEVAFTVPASAGSDEKCVGRPTGDP